MAIQARPTTRQLARAAFAEPLEWENQPAWSTVARQTGPGTWRTNVAARGTFRRRSSFRASFRSSDSTTTQIRDREDLSKGPPRDAGRAAHTRPAESKRDLEQIARPLDRASIDSPEFGRKCGVKVLRGRIKRTNRARPSASPNVRAVKPTRILD